MNIDLKKLEIHDVYIKDEKNTIIFKAVNDSDVTNKTYLDEKLFEKHGHLSFLEKDYNESELHCIKQAVEEVLIQRAVNKTIQKLYDKGLFDNFPNAENVLKD